MKFNEDGYLDPGFHDIDLQDINEKFVDNFKESITRQDIIKGYIRFMKDLKECGVDNFECWIDGSFSTNKTNPNDIDMVLVIDRGIIEKIPMDKQGQLLKLLTPDLARIEYKCDAYILAKVDNKHEDYNKYELQKNYWKSQFGTDRNSIPKGMLRINIEGEVS